MLRKLKKVVTASLLVMLPTAASAEVLFSDTFDSKADWSVPYATSSQACNKETGCTNKPLGYYGFYMSPSVIPPNGHGLHLNSTNKRGATGKGLTFWDQTNGTNTWTSGTQIAVDFPGRKEIYVRYWTKMQPNYKFMKTSGSSMLRKLNHISHYMYNGKPYTFFTDGGHHPTTVNTIQFSNNNIANLQNNFIIRPDTNYNGTQLGTVSSSALSIPTATGAYNYFDLPDDALPKGNYSGTGTEYNSPGMLADGKWHCLEFYVKSNTIPGVADGAYKFWLDGIIQIDATGLLYRDVNSKLPEDIWNFVHIGGNAFNAFLGAGVSGEQWYAVDDLVISTTYSGPPPKPVNVQATSLSASSIKVAWSAGTNNVSYPLTGYRIYYGTDPANLSQSMTVGNVTQAEVTNLTAGKTYYFSVAGYNKGAQDSNENESLRSKTASAATGAAVAAPATTDTTAPVASILAPVAGAVVSGTVSLSVSATDNVAVSKVELYLNGAVFSVLGTAPYTVPWNSTTKPNGAYTLTAKAYDAAGNVTSKSVSFTVSNTTTVTADTTAPTVNTFAMPTTASSLTVPVTSFTAGDNKAVTGYMVTATSTKPLASATNWSTTAPTSFTFPGTGLRTAYAWAKDAAGNVSAARSASVTIATATTTTTTADTTLPTITMASPTSTTLYGGTLTIKGSATDNVGVTKMQVFVDQSNVYSTTNSYVSVSKLVSLGYHTVLVKAYDAALNVKSYTIKVNRVS